MLTLRDVIRRIDQNQTYSGNVRLALDIKNSLMHSIEVYTRGKSVYAHILAELETFIEQSGLDVQIKEIKDAEQISAQNPPSLPYFTLEGAEPIYLSHGEYVHTFCSRLRSWLVNNVGQGKLERVLIPIDFSASSLNAVKFVLKRYRERYALIEMISAHEEVITSINGVPVVDNKLLLSLTEKMDKYVATLRNDELNGKMVISGKILTGATIPSILKAAKRRPNTVMYVGSSGKSGPIKNIFGSVTRQLVKKATVPLFIIPPNYESMALTDVAFAVSDPENDGPVFEQLYQLIGSYNPTLYLVHNETADDDFDFDDYKESTSRFHGHLVKTMILTHGNPAQKINEFMENNNFHLLVMSHYQRPILESIFHKSVAKEVVSNIQCPILIINLPKSRTNAEQSKAASTTS